MAPDSRVSELFVFPVKSMRGHSVKRWRLDATGLELDREWVVVDRGYKQMTQRELPKMALINVVIEYADGVDEDGLPNAFKTGQSLIERGGTLVLSAEGAPGDLRIPFPSKATNSVPLQVWDDTVWGLDEGDEAATWLSSFLRNLRVSPGGFRLCVKDRKTPRKTDRIYTPGETPDAQSAFQDQYPLSILTNESLADVNARLADLEITVPMVNFRPTIAISGATEPYEEDTWKKITIAGHVIHVVKRCTRCQIPNIDPATGLMSKEPLRLLQRYRCVDKGMPFSSCLSMLGIHQETGWLISVGDLVEVLETGEHLIRDA